MGDTLAEVPRVVVPHLLTWLAAGFSIASILLCLAQVWAARFSVPSDALSYLDMGDLYIRGDWAHALTGHWSPLYACLLSLTLAVLRPTPYWESTAAQLVNAGIFVLTLACFTFFLRELLLTRAKKQALLDKARFAFVPEWALLVIAYVIFTWSSLNLITAANISPDMLVAACVYTVGALTLKIERGSAGWRTFLMLGVVLGTGYLVKAPLFPMAFVFLGTAFLSAGNLRWAAPRVVVSLIVFLAIASPLVMALSRVSGSLTFGSSAAWNYARFVDGIGIPVHWQGEPPGSGHPVHPTRELFSSPTVYEFGTPVAGTYPPWYDPAYWYEGTTPHFDLREQLKVLGQSAQTYTRIFLDLHGTLLLTLLAVLGLSLSGGSLLATLREYWLLIVPALVALLMYAFVYVEPRYVGAYIALILIAPIAGARLPRSRVSVWAPAFLAIMIFASWGFSAGRESTGVVQQDLQSLLGRQAKANPSLQVAQGISSLALKSGSNIGYIGESYEFYWARLGHWKIVAEIRQPADRKSVTDGYVSPDRASWWDRRDVDDFWVATPDRQALVMQAFVKAGASAVVTDAAPPGVSTSTWKPVGTTGYYIHFLTGTSAGSHTPSPGQRRMVALRSHG